jgi:solute carrier family 25 citrate transporter 1
MRRFTALYKGLTAVPTGIIPKISILFLSFERYCVWLQALNGGPSNAVSFTAGLALGLTEAILFVTSAEVSKICMQSQYHIMMDPAQM